MTKPKRPRPPKPALAWCVYSKSEKKLMPEYCFDSRALTREWIADFTDPVIIRVEIRPAPKRKGARK